MLPQFGGGELRIVEVISHEADKPAIRSLRGLIYHFRPDGTLDMGEAAHAIDILLLPKQLPDHGQNVFSVLPDLKGKAWDTRHSWDVDPGSIHLIEDDLAGSVRLPPLRLASI